MDHQSRHLWEHDHVFGQDQVMAGERRTLLVVIITACMMVVEITAGFAFGSMALLADGLHMGSHAAALGISVFAYRYARKHAHDRHFSFGTGKVNALAGFTSGILLMMFALMMAWESINRFFDPVAIAFNQAIAVAIAGFIVNGASMFILRTKHHHHGAAHGHAHHHVDHNLRAAYLHVFADALTSIFTIFALLTGKYFGLVWMDPLMGIVGATLVSRWSWILINDTSHVLLDHQAPSEVEQKIRMLIEQDVGNRIADLHIWAIGPNIYTAAISIITDNPKPPDHYKGLLPDDLGIVHATVEVHRHVS
jgi:cation diffusion facilitator family transporter